MIDDDDDESEVLEKTPFEHQDVYEVAHSHGWAGVPITDSAAILALQFGMLDEAQSRVAWDAYHVGVVESAEHAAALKRPQVADARIPF